MSTKEKDSKVRFKNQRPSSGKSRPSSGKSSRSSKKIKEKGKLSEGDDSPIDSLTTNVAALPVSSDSEIESDPINSFSRVGDTEPREPIKRDKINLHDRHGRQSAVLPKPKEDSVTFVDTVKREVIDKGDNNKPPDKPVTLSERINLLEIEAIGHNLELIEGSMFSPRSETELKDLHDKLHSYIARMRELRTGAAHLDSHTFFKSVDAMEREVKNLKSTYDREILKLRRELEDVSRTKNHLELKNSKLEASASSLQTRIAAEVETNKRMNEDICSLTRQIQRKELEFQHTVKTSLDSESKLTNTGETTKQLDQTLRENMQLNHRYETELLQRRELDDKCHRLEQQIQFDTELHKQQMQDLQDRLAAASTAILHLEGKVEVLNRPDQDEHISQMISSVRDAAERELYKYKQESEEMFNRNITMLKAQMDADRKSFEAVTDENRRLTGVIEELNTKARNLQGEILHLQHGKRSAEENVQVERDRALRHIQALETKLKDLQDMLFDKMKELNAARVQNLPLKAEVESLRALMDEEEKRLSAEMRLPPISNAINSSPDTTRPRSGLASDPIVQPHSSQLHEQLQAETYSTYPTQLNTSIEAAEPILPGGSPLYTGNAGVSFAMDLGQTDVSYRPDSGSKPVGPVRTKSAQSDRPTERGIKAQNILDVSAEFENQAVLNGTGGVQGGDEQTMMASSTPLPPAGSVSAHDYNHCTNSATGNLRIHEVSPDGSSITLANTSKQLDIDVGGFVLQQNVGGSPVALFRFPPKITFKAKTFIVVFAGCNDPILHQPPSQFVWKEQQRWGTGPECTTVLCKPNGQAVAWSTAAHRFNAVQYAESRSVSRNGITEEPLPVYTKDPNEPPNDVIYLRRQKESPPLLAANKHPHGIMNSHTHPQTSERREKELGNDNSSNNRQSRVMTQRPDPVPGELYAGIKGQHMGIASERRYTSRSAPAGNIRKNGALAKRPDQIGVYSQPPSSFMTPRNRYQSGLLQIRSAHHSDFIPPMPRPPLCAGW